MKFYYKGQLIRTSETHGYVCAVVGITDGKVSGKYGCRASWTDGQSLLMQAERQHGQIAAKYGEVITLVTLSREKRGTHEND